MSEKLEQATHNLRKALEETKSENNDRITIECCKQVFDTSNPETAFRWFAKHLEDEHDIPRNAISKFVLADANVRDYEAGKVKE